MKKIGSSFIPLLIIVIFILLILVITNYIVAEKNKEETKLLQNEVVQLNAKIKEIATNKNGVKHNGQLSIKESHLINNMGDKIQLRGMSSHGLMWYPEYTNYRAIETTQEYGANMFRIAMYTDESKGYIYNPQEAKTAMYMAIENTIGADMYVVVDWHILKDENPNTYINEAIAFFNEVSKRYSNEPAILYEICNEPNGETTWADIKQYADIIIPVIRKNSSNAIILVGTPKHSTQINDVINEPLSFDNIMYTYHYYTNLSDGGYKHNIPKALKNGLPIFVSEWGVGYEESSGEIDFAEGKEFVEFLNQNNISWASWSLSNKDEDHSAVKSSSSKLSKWKAEDLTNTGQFIFEALSGKSER